MSAIGAAADHPFGVLTRLRIRMFRFVWVPVLVAGLASPAVMVRGATIKPVELPALPPPPESTRIYDANGRLIATLHGEENRIVISRALMPEHLRQAVIAAEDHHFYDHPGVSFPSILRALKANVTQDRIVQGGSTITQQYVRNAIAEVGKKRTFGRKLKEAMLAIRLEQKYSKDEILDRYMNTVYFGRGAYGVEAAAKTYFGKPARALVLEESAYLAGVIRAPEAYVAKPKSAKARRDHVLDQMAELAFITPAEAIEAKAKPMQIRHGRIEPVQAAYFVEYVRRLLKTPESEGGFSLTDREILTGGLRVYTTLDLRMQSAAERAVLRVLDRPDDPEAALVAMTSDGQIRAMVGGRDFTSIERARGFNFATQLGGGGRQVGSAFKPFTLLAYVRQGYSVRSVFPAPARIVIRRCMNGLRPWSPGNYGGTGFGALSVVDATAYSVNTVYAQLVALVGPENALQAARDSGIVSPMLPVCSIALGVFGVTPLEMTRAYATFSARGARPQILAVRKILGPDGKVIARRMPRAKQTIERGTADTVNQVLRRVMTKGTGRPAAVPYETAGKTGTTDNRKDVWFAGYTATPGLAAAAWVGYPPDGNGKIQRMYNLHGVQATGGRFPGHIWKYFMEEALRIAPVASFAPGDFGGRPAGGRLGSCAGKRDAPVTVYVPEAEVSICATPTQTPSPEESPTRPPTPAGSPTPHRPPKPPAPPPEPPPSPPEPSPTPEPSGPEPTPEPSESVPPTEPPPPRTPPPGQG